jgi:hypothetical protein
MALLRVGLWIPILWVGLLLPVLAQEEEVAPEQVSKPPVVITFTPPDLAGTTVLGIFDAAGKLARTLRFEEGSDDLKIDTNGYVLRWDGLNEGGKPCPAGRYSARGYVIGDGLKVAGEAFHFNDWMAEDGIPAQGVKLWSGTDGVGVELQTAAGPVFKRIDADGALKTPTQMSWGESPLVVPPQITPAPLGWAAGREGTTWLILDTGDGQHTVVQLGSGDESSRRELRVPKDEPQPIEIAASTTEDVILLKEASAGGVVRVRMLKRGDAVSEKDGHRVSDWEVVFERSFQPCAQFGLVEGKLAAETAAAPVDAIAVPLVENALRPGAREKLRLQAVATLPGSALASPDGLELVEVSSEGNWNRFSISGNERQARLYQGDGIVVEEFSIEGLDQVAAFDAGTFLLAPAEQ